MMSANLIQSLAQLLKIQQSLNKIASEKTELLKRNEIQELEKLLQKEEQQVYLLEKADEARHEAVLQFMQAKGVESEDAIVSSLYPLLSEEDQALVEKLQMKLMEELIELKERNELNEELTKQSLYYVNASLTMFNPESASVTYKRPNHKMQENERQSIFDSKA